MKKALTKHAEMGIFLLLKLSYFLHTWSVWEWCVLEMNWKKTSCFTGVNNTLDKFTLFNTAVNCMDSTNISVIIFLHIIETLKWKCVLLGWGEKRLEKSASPSGSLPKLS